MDLKTLGLTSAKTNQLNSKGIYTVEDLLNYLPRDYRDCSHLTGILDETQRSVVYLEVLNVRTTVGKAKGTDTIIVTCRECETKVKVRVLFFNQHWRMNTLYGYIGKGVLASGKITRDEYKPNEYTLCMPDTFDIDVAGAMRIYPIYKKVPKMSAEYLEDKIKSALETLLAYQDNCPSDIIKRENVVPLKQAYSFLHNPQSIEEIEKGKERILFNDLLYFALNNEWCKRNSSAGSQYNIKSLALTNKIRDNLSYELTVDQKAAVDQMIADGKTGRRINALVQGDVGCGKTITAFLVMAAFVSSGYQAALMAPTQVLARQHYEDLKAVFDPIGVNVIFLSGDRMTKKARAEVLKKIEDGSAQIVVGTHALISDSVKYKKLALTITDEEHKFGVAQRAALTEKAANGVHNITMSATPIPRSLAQVVYGDSVQLYTIKTMPKGRKPVQTAYTRNRESIYKFILRQKAEGHQVYVVCPMIDQNTDVEHAKSIEETSKEYMGALLPHGVRIKTLTGRNTKEETVDIIDRFKSGETDVLIATTVIEVGVNVPNATAMIITSANRFGLSQMHQLRGRVGRSSFQSYCVLEADEKTERIEIMCSTSDGFEIAQEDLKLRGAGDFLGTKQSGDNKYMSLMLAYPDKYQRAKQIAQELLDRGVDCCKLTKQIASEREEEE